MKNKLHKHNTELYDRVSAYINNQSESNAIALVEWCQREGGKITGYYPTTYVSQADIEETVNDEQYEELNHEDMKKAARFIGGQDVENGTYWEAIREFYYQLLRK